MTKKCYIKDMKFALCLFSNGLEPGSVREFEWNFWTVIIWKSVPINLYKLAWMCRAFNLELET